jgi:hypothetical protein
MDNSWRFRAASAAVSVSGGGVGGGEGGDFSPGIFGSGRIFEEVCDTCVHTHTHTHKHTHIYRIFEEVYDICSLLKRSAILL